MHSPVAVLLHLAMLIPLSSSLKTSIRVVKSRSISSSRLSALKNFYAVPEDELKQTMKSWGQPSFRVGQVRSWVYEKGVDNFANMLDLPVALRTKLTENFSVGDLTMASEQVSKDGTTKRAYALHDGQLIESVLMPYEDGRRTACISSQAGCAMGCVFCATGQMGFFRQLTSTEIFEQVQRFSCELKRDGQRLSNVVMMGMGEPLANYDNVMEAVRRMNTELGIGARHITISTVGLAPRIRKLADEDMQVGLAVSLHQADNAKRSTLMPVNKRYPIPELLDACRYYVQKTNRRISFEWALIRNETDTVQTARDLGMLLRGLHCHVNVIPLNPTALYGGKPTPKAGVDEFIRVLGEYGITATPRTRRGIDIEAGCGQLTTELMKRRKKTPSSESESESLSESDAESDLRLITLLDPTRTIEGDDALAVDGGEVEGETEESLDKSFLSRDVEKERQITFAEIENANR